MKKGSFIFFAIVCNGFVMNAQVDSLAMNKSDDTTMEEIVITTEIEPQSLKKAINNVRVITKEDIRNLGAVNLGDVLNQYINITVTPSSSSGRSTVSMFGLDANYFKVLVDNIPLVNEGGLGNNTDLSQINLNDVERIEIIEGSMGVTHGANAVSGILNIITKKSSGNKWELSLTSQEETVGKEFSFFKEGRHIQALKVNHNINDHWFVTLGVNRNDFQGFMGTQNGKFYETNDGTRGYKWLPKEQLQGNALINYTNDKLRLFYKFEFLDENIDFYGPSVQSGYSDNLGPYKYGDDMRYFTNRLYQHLNASGKLFNQINFNISVSHQLQKREEEAFRYNITHDLESNNIKQKDQEMNVLYSTGTFNNFFESKLFNLQLGYEIARNKGFAIVDEDANKKKEVNETLSNYDFFAVSDISLSDNFSLRPGFRYSFQSMFENQYAYSLGGRYLLANGYEARAAFGKSFRTPDFNELFTRMVFDGHYFIGNENLLPEKSTSFEASLKKISYFSESNSSLSNHLMVSHSNVKDRITSALIGYEGATPMYKNINISEYKNFNVSSTNQFQIKNWDFGLGLSLTWFSQLIDNAEYKTSDKFLFSYTANGKISHTVPKWNTTFSAYYKLIGKSPLWILGSDNYVISEVDSYSWLDMSIRKTFWNNKFETTIGARNLLNVSDVNQSRTNESGGHAAPSQLLLAYGRSYFIKLTYNFNLN